MNTQAILAQAELLANTAKMAPEVCHSGMVENYAATLTRHAQALLNDLEATGLYLEWATQAMDLLSFAKILERGCIQIAHDIEMRGVALSSAVNVAKASISAMSDRNNYIPG